MRICIISDLHANLEALSVLPCGITTGYACSATSRIMVRTARGHLTSCAPLHQG